MGWEVNKIFQARSSCELSLRRDKLTIHRTAGKVRETVADFASLPEDRSTRESTNCVGIAEIGESTFAQADLLNHPDTEQHIVSIRYRPFDARWTYYTQEQSAGVSSEATSRILCSICNLVDKSSLSACVAL